MSMKEQAAEWYEANVKGRGIKLAPAHVVALKDALTKAIRKGEKLGIVARSFYKEHSITVPAKDEPRGARVHADHVSHKDAMAGTIEAKPKKRITVEVPAEESPKARKRTATTETTRLEVSKVDRKSLKATLDELRRAGAKVPDFDKEWTDDELRMVVHEALGKVTQPKTVALLEKINMDQVRAITGDCLGLFVDLRTAQCVACPTTEACVKQYLKNLGDNFVVFRDALDSAKTEEDAEETTRIEKEEDEEVAAKPTAKTGSKKPTTTKPAEEPETEEETSMSEKPAVKAAIKVKKVGYDPERMVIVPDIKSPYDKTDDEYAFYKACLAEGSCKMSKIREFAEDPKIGNFEFDSDQGFMDTLFNIFRSAGLLLFAEDLDEDTVNSMDKATKKFLGIK